MIPGLGPGGLLPVQFMGQLLELRLGSLEFCLGVVKVGYRLGDGVCIVLQGLGIGLDLAFQELDFIPCCKCLSLELIQILLSSNRRGVRVTQGGAQAVVLLASRVNFP